MDVVEAIVRDELDYWISDGGPPAFRPAALEAPVGAENGDDAAAEALRAFARDSGGAMPVPATAWRALFRGPREVLFHCVEDEEHYLVTVECDRKGRWSYRNSSYYFESLAAIRDGNQASEWRLDPSADAPTPADTRLHVHVTESHCASGRSAEGRIEAPDVFYVDDEIRIVAYVTRLRGSQRCPGNPPTPATFVLPEPIGERRLVDAGSYEL